MPNTLRTERTDVRFKVKEGIENVWIDAESQSETGRISGEVAGIGLRLYTDDIGEAETIAEFLNKNVRQLLVISGHWSE
ncbi:MAG: hypothetical protein WDM87_05750 [Terracidiphilus sp.]